MLFVVVEQASRTICALGSSREDGKALLEAFTSDGSGTWYQSQRHPPLRPEPAGASACGWISCACRPLACRPSQRTYACRIHLAMLLRSTSAPTVLFGGVVSPVPATRPLMKCVRPRSPSRHMRLHCLKRRRSCVLPSRVRRRTSGASAQETRAKGRGNVAPLLRCRCGKRRGAGTR